VSNPTPTRTSYRRGISGNPGGRPATAELSALARRYTADWMRGLVGVVRMPVCRENAPSIVSAARTLAEYGYPGIGKGTADEAHASLHLHLLAVSGDVQATLQGAVQGVTLEGVDWALGGGDAPGDAPGDLHEPPLDEAWLPPLDERLPHEALPLWDAAAGADQHDTQEDSSRDEAAAAEPADAAG
jgi:hypothetical protein